MIWSKLETTPIGILCVTPDNQKASWLNFEGGALLKNVEGQESRVIPDLMGFSKKADLELPLSQLYAVQYDEEGTRDLIESINAALPAPVLGTDVLRKSFDTFWPQLATSLSEVSASSDAAPTGELQDIAEETLGTVRDLAARMSRLESSTSTSTSTIRPTANPFEEFMRSVSIMPLSCPACESNVNRLTGICDGCGQRYQLGLGD